MQLNNPVSEALVVFESVFPKHGYGKVLRSNRIFIYDGAAGILKFEKKVLIED